MLEAAVFVSLLALLLVVFALVNHRDQKKFMKLQSGEIQKHLLELGQRNQQLQELGREKMQVISLVSHDLKGPFNRIFALIQLMNLDPANLSADQKEYLGKIHQIAVDGLGMVRNIMDSRKMEDQGIELSDKSLDLSSLVASLVKNYRAIADKKKIQIEFEAVAPLHIKADKSYLGRVVENLLSNAVKFSPENKKIFVRLERRPDSIELSIKDEGPGISHEDQKKLFQRFQRLSARPTGAESSTGLGLFIVKTIVDKMGAEIRCESEDGQGTCFVVSLPQKFFS